MMKRIRDRVTEICEAEFDRQARAAAAESASCRLSKQVPVIGGEFRQERLGEYLGLISRAIAAQERHALLAPKWAVPLPLQLPECERLIVNEHNELKLLGYFGRSMRWREWDPKHPLFNDFCSGVLDWLHCPVDLKLDRGLKRVFPPKELVGLISPAVAWRAPEMV
jgi:hypothetical protein